MSAAPTDPIAGTPAPPPAASREVRLGIVMYGGVSLAIYIFGVANEFFRVVRGRGAYGLLQALTDSDVVVDVISGTSAGGINGILLASALCNESELADVASLWSEDGDIADLLRAPGGDPAACVSVLDSEGKYLPKLRSAFARLHQARIRPEAGERTGPPTELDLFITGTDVAGRVYTMVDDAGHAIDVRDHRTVFWLKHRLGRKTPFAPAHPQPGHDDAALGALARLATITSCFPAVFAPVRVGLDGEEDARLREWGRIGRETWFLDGGVLDNKPFTPTLKAIFSRVADRDVERRLFYVEPDPERFQQDRACNQPNAVEAAVAALIGIPGYESIAEDLEMLAQHNSRLETYRRLLGEVQPMETAAGPAAAGVEAPSLAGERLYLRSRLVALSARVARGVLWEGDDGIALRGADREQARRLVTDFDGLVAASAHGPWDKAGELLTRFDAYYGKRRVIRVIYLLHELLHQRETAPSPERAAAYRNVLFAFNRQLKLYEILIAAMEGLVDDARYPWRTAPTERIWELVQSAFTQLLAPDAAPMPTLEQHADAMRETDWRGWLPQQLLDVVWQTLQDRARELRRAIAEGTLGPADDATLLDGIAAWERRLLAALIADAADPVHRAYDDFARVDARVFPLELFGDIGEKDIVRTVRISPVDAQRGFSARPGAAKIAGDAVHHFGGFFKRSWRSNDILWGRLDGLCQLFECLLAADRLRTLGDDPVRRARVRDRLAAPPLDPATVFPRSGEPTHEILRGWFRDLFDDAPATRARALAAFDARRDLLIEAAQLEIIGEQVPAVIRDAIAEQHRWNAFRPAASAPGATGYDMTRDGFVAASGTIDPLVALTGAATLAAEQIAKASHDGVSATCPAATPLGTFFRSHYHVGSEDLQRDVPQLVLLAILARALRVVHDCLLNAVGTRRAARLTGSPLYQLFVNGPLHAFELVIRLAGGSRSRGRPLVIVLVLLAVVTMVAGVAAQWQVMLTGLLSIATFIGLPLLAVWVLVTLVMPAVRGGGMR